MENRLNTLECFPGAPHLPNPIRRAPSALARPPHPLDQPTVDVVSTPELNFEFHIQPAVTGRLHLQNPQRCAVLPPGHVSSDEHHLIEMVI